MKIKTSEATPLQIDWLVAHCVESSKLFPIFVDGAPVSKGNYSTNWAQGGPIIEREKITVEYTGDPDTWCACIMADQEVYGDTPLIAAMRCYVASKLGDEVEIPEELT